MAIIFRKLCNRHWVEICGTFYICIMLLTFYYVAMGYTVTQAGQVYEVAEIDSIITEYGETRNLSSNGNVKTEQGEVTCPTCNCTRFDMPVTKRHPEPSEMCPQTPPGLVGRLGVNGNTTADKVINQTALDQLSPGGFYNPVHCKAREKVAVIIPYRNRAHHLEILLYHLHVLLQRQELDYAIFVTELALPTQFNRGILANIGYLTAMTVDNFTCIVIHDVDLLPANDRNLYRCNPRIPRHLSVSNSKYNYQLPYGHYIGGIVAFTPYQFNKINGFSNAYFGWGKEDDDLLKRILNQHYRMDRPAEDIGVYEALPHNPDRTNPDNVMKDSLLLDRFQRSKRDGLNSITYSRLALEFRPLYTWVYVKVNEAHIMEAVEYAIARIPRKTVQSD